MKERDVLAHVRSEEGLIRNGGDDCRRLGQQLTFRCVYSYLAHEMNHPLGTISNLASLMERRLNDPVVRPSDMKEQFEAIKQETRRAADVIRQMRVLAGGLREHVEPIQCHDFLHDAVARFRQRCPSGMVDIRVDCSDRALTMEGASELLHIALYNLMVNGLDAARAARVDRPQLTLCAGIVDGAVVLDVLDNGGGVDAEIAPRLFEPFVSSKKGGSGLGLAICRDIIEWHGGKISCDTVPLQGGTRFRLTMARRQANGKINGRFHSYC